MNKIFLAVIGVIVVAAGIVAFSALYTVHQTQQALVLQFGNPIKVNREPVSYTHLTLPTSDLV